MLVFLLARAIFFGKHFRASVCHLILGKVSIRVPWFPCDNTALKNDHDLAPFNCIRIMEFTWFQFSAVLGVLMSTSYYHINKHCVGQGMGVHNPAGNRSYSDSCSIVFQKCLMSIFVTLGQTHFSCVWGEDN